ncbi:MAG: Tyrocidine synthase 2 [Verrucomicrobiae bacterium]|nr:Tyrocidine synthase 2 [Verrucomicrobiae bacterium]
MTKPGVVWTKRDCEQTIPQRFATIVARYPGQIAIRTRDATWTYRELDRRAQTIATALRNLRGDALEPVGLLFPQGAWQCAATLGALQARKIYVPLDQSLPPARRAEIVAEAEIKVVLTDTKQPGTVDVTKLESSEEFRLPAADCRDPAYIYFTSGTTGKPKGVVDSHRNVLHNILRYTSQLHIQATDRLSLLQAPAFSGAVSSFFAAVLNGATSLPADVRAEHPDALAEWLIAERATMLHGVPALIRSLLRPGRRFPALRVVRLEGDQATSQDVELFRQHFPADCLLANGLGATEMGLARQFIITPATAVPAGILPVGYPVPDVRVLILDENGLDAGVETVGEIAAQSEYLALGYWKNPTATAARFLVTPAGRIYRTGDRGRLRADGCLEFLGRTDSRIKIRGQFVDLAEVETAVLALPAVWEAAVVARPNQWGENEIVAFVVAPIAVAKLRAELVGQLPAVMMPTRLVAVDRLPLNENGKVDRRALQSRELPSVELTGSRAPRTECELKLAAIWAVVLGRESVAVDAPFLELGGDSLRALQILSRVRDEFRIELTPQEFFNAPTVLDQARLLANAGSL